MYKTEEEFLMNYDSDVFWTNSIFDGIPFFQHKNF